jgi:hypothetical protein
MLSTLLSQFFKLGTRIILYLQVNSLAENVSQILDFQSSFCCEIQQLIDCEEDFKNINEVGLFQVRFMEICAGYAWMSCPSFAFV